MEQLVGIDIGGTKMPVSYTHLAKEKLYITNALSRMLYGATARNRPSRFLSDIPPELIEAVSYTHLDVYKRQQWR